MSHTADGPTRRAPHPSPNDHAAFAQTVAGGPLTAEGRGALHRYRALALGIVGILIFAVGMLVSYSAAFTNPAPNHLALAVAGNPAAIVQLEQQEALTITVVADDAAARAKVTDRDVDGAVILPTDPGAAVTVYVAGGNGKALTTAITAIGGTIADRMQTTSTVVDLAPLSSDDPGGTLEFYLVVFVAIGSALAASVFGRILGTVKTAASFIERSVVLVVFTGILAAVATFWVDGVMNGLTENVGGLFLAVWLYALAVGGAVTGVAALFGTVAALLVTLLLTMLGNPSSGGPFGIHLLPDFFQSLYWVFPQGDGLEAVRSIAYFDGAGASGPLTRLFVWAVAGLTLTLIAMFVQARRALREAKAAQAATATPSDLAAAPTTRMRPAIHSGAVPDGGPARVDTALTGATPD